MNKFILGLLFLASSVFAKDITVDVIETREGVDIEKTLERCNKIASQFNHKCGTVLRFKEKSMYGYVHDETQITFELLERQYRMNIIDFINTLKDGDNAYNIISFEKYLKSKKYKTIKGAVNSLEELTRQDIERKFGHSEIIIDLYGLHDPIIGDTFDKYTSLYVGAFSIFDYYDCELLDVTLVNKDNALVVQLEV